MQVSEWCGNSGAARANCCAMSGLLLLVIEILNTITLYTQHISPFFLRLIALDRIPAIAASSLLCRTQSEHFFVTRLHISACICLSPHVCVLDFGVDLNSRAHAEYCVISHQIIDSSSRPKACRHAFFELIPAIHKRGRKATSGFPLVCKSPR